MLYPYTCRLQGGRAVARVNVRSRGPQGTWGSGFADIGLKGQIDLNGQLEGYSHMRIHLYHNILMFPLHGCRKYSGGLQTDPQALSPAWLTGRG
jgi:hypothetical protein